MKLPRLLDTRQRVMLDVMENDRFLPVERMHAGLEDWTARYRTAEPFPHIVIDDLFDRDILDCIEAEFPAPASQSEWQPFRHPNEWYKNATKSDRQIPFFTRQFLYALNSRGFLAWLEELTGIQPLIPDTEFVGGGLHSVLPGGRLEIHADFNRHLRNDLDRRINLLLYLNRDWPEEYGGHLELWDRDMTHARQRILPVFGRMVIFGTNDFTYHGHPGPVNCPPDRFRKSIALYLYSNGRPEEERSDSDHLTLYQQRPTG